jgi:hypothetical protein
MGWNRIVPVLGSANGTTVVIKYPVIKHILGRMLCIGPEKHFRESGIIWAIFGLQKQIEPEVFWYRLGWIWLWAGVLGRAGSQD